MKQTLAVSSNMGGYGALLRPILGLKEDEARQYQLFC
jgi:hypothetical protein